MDESPVTSCPASQRAGALRLLHAASAAGQQEGLAEAVAAASKASEFDWRGLLVTGEPQPTAALWLQPTPGNTALIWPPPPDAPAADALFRAASALVDDRGIAVAQLNVGRDEGFSPQRLAATGFPKLAELLYLFAELPCPTPGPQSDVRFVPFAGDDPHALAQLVERTYVGTRDCPALDRVRKTADVLAGYRAQGQYMPEHWYAVELPGSGEAVGVLLLADHPSAGNWEVIYLGIVPTARGRRLGDDIVRFALQTAARAGARRLVLAVDAANDPALAMYRRSGFSEWDRRSVYARFAPVRASN